MAQCCDAFLSHTNKEALQEVEGRVEEARRVKNIVNSRTWSKQHHQRWNQPLTTTTTDALLSNVKRTIKGRQVQQFTLRRTQQQATLVGIGISSPANAVEVGSEFATKKLSPITNLAEETIVNEVFYYEDIGQQFCLWCVSICAYHQTCLTDSVQVDCFI